MDLEINEAALSAIEKINGLGNRAYICGNTVRELLSGEASSVYMLITDASPKKIKTMFRRILETNEKKHYVRITENRIVIQIFTVQESIDFDVFLKNTLSSFDFTVNSMAYSPECGIIDPFGGLEDFKERIIKFCDFSEMTLAEKPTRMMRAVRYAAQTGFCIEEKSTQLIKKCSMLIKRSSHEKIREELDKILLSQNPFFIEQLHTLGLMHYILPEVDVCFGVPQKNKYHIYNVGEHIMHTVEYSPNDLLLRWAALLHDIGKPDSKSVDSNGIIHFYGHHRQSVRLASEILRKFRFDSEQQKDILTLIENHDVRIDASLIAVKKIMSKTGSENFEKLLLLQEADNMAKNRKYLKEKLNRINEVRKLYQKVVAERQPYRVSDLVVNGRDLAKLGFKTGYEISDTLSELLNEVLINPDLNTREGLIQLAKKYRTRKKFRR